jgi:hypothetical protein
MIGCPLPGCNSASERSSVGSLRSRQRHATDGKAYPRMKNGDASIPATLEPGELDRSLSEGCGDAPLEGRAIPAGAD